MRGIARIVVLPGLGMLAACSAKAPASHPVATVVSRPAHIAAFVNGDFESGSVGTMPPPNWTLLNYKNPGVSGTASAPPSTQSALNLTGLGTMVNETFVVGGATMTMTDPDLGSSETFRYPLYGTQAARVNYKDATTNGKNQNVNLIRQVMTVDASDLDPGDGQVHIRSAIAPVLENPSHTYYQQPYYFVELLNLTKGTTLYTAFNTAGQTGVPWHNATSVATHNAVQWLDWAMLDIAPGPAALAVGDQIQLTIIGSGCSLGGHFGRVYVDGVGSTIPGPYVYAGAAASVNAGDTLTYTVHYGNGGTATAAAIGAHVDMTMPPQTTFSSVSGVSNCTTPSVGGTGVLSCPVGTLAVGATGSFTVTVTVGSGASGSIVNGTYSIGAVNATTLLGPKVTTTVNGSGTSKADIVVVKTATPSSINWGSSTYYCSSKNSNCWSGSTLPLYTVTITNNSANVQLIRANIPTVSDTLSANLTNIYWRCQVTTAGSGVGSGGGNNNISQCKDSSSKTTASGTSNTISIAPRLGYGGGKITIKVWAQVVASTAGTGNSIVNTASSTAGVGVVDPDMTNNTSTVTVPIGTPRTLTLTKDSPSNSGSVLSSPSGISCGTTTTCNPATATFIDGSQVVLMASPIPGATFSGWTGTGVPAGCTGTPAPTTCTVTMSADKAITATFVAPAAGGTAKNLYLYTGTPQRTRISTAFPSPLKVLVTDTNGVPVSGVTVNFSAPASGASATLAASAVTNTSGIASVSATANATPGTYSVTASSSGLTGQSSVNFALTNVGDPASVIYVSGGNITWDATDRQMATVNTAYASPLVARVLDVNSQPVPSTTVTYTAPSSGATLTTTTATATTDNDGLSLLAVTANATSGQFSVTASAAGASSSARFDLWNRSAGVSGIYPVSGTPQTVAINAAFVPLVAVVSDEAGNALPGQTVTFQVQAGSTSASATLSGGSACPSPSSTCQVVTTNSAGLATITATANGNGGGYTVNATVSGVATPAAFSLTNDGGQSIAVKSGSPQFVTPLGAGYASALVAEVLDVDGNAVVDGTVVTFLAPASGATVTLSGGSGTCPAPLDSATHCRLATTSSGLASVNATANNVAGAFTVSASTPNAPTAALFSLTNQCANSGDCAAATPYCNLSTNLCEVCTLDSQCASLHCLTSVGTCVGCLSDSTCSGTTPICSQSTNSCSACANSTQCATKNASAPTCQSDGSCTGCADDSGCSGSTPACLSGACVGCTSNTYCTATTAPICNTSANTCGPCASDSDCSGFTNKTACQDSGACGQCSASNSSACTGATPYCLTSSATCVACLSNSDCPQNAPNCFSASHTCGGCTSDSDCSGGQYCSSSACVAKKADGQVCANDGQCANAHCLSGICCATACGACGTCSLGTCTPLSQGTTNCGAYVCNGSSTDCPSTCAASSDCQSGNYCASGTCATKKTQGTSCTGAEECANGLCVDGYCCNSACTGQCQACDSTGNHGTCVAIAGVPHGSRPGCSGTAAACSGACDGTGASACVYPAGETICRAASCTNGIASAAATCNGNGGCPDSTSSACGAYVCDTSACKTSCTSPADCATGFLCYASTCAPAFSITANVTGGHGTLNCPSAAAQGASPVCNTTPESGYILDTLTDAAGSGAATDVSASVNRHDTIDASDDDYTVANVQSARTLTATFKKNLATTCASASECHAGFCVDGVCCSAACSGQCQACDVSGSIGTCANVTGAPHGSRTACTSDGSSCAGACDGAHASQCLYPTTNTGCRAASCAGGTATLAAVCDGSGACPAITQSTCGRYLCGTTSCKTSCTTTDDCSTGNLCYQGACESSLTIVVVVTGGHGSLTCPSAVAQGASPECSVTPDSGYVLDSLTDAAGSAVATNVTDLVNQHAPSDPLDDTYAISAMQVDHTLTAVFKVSLGGDCTNAGQCHSGFCADGVCCDGACSGQCQACDRAGNLGTCGTVTGAPHGTRTACLSDTSACAGSCDGISPTSCHYPASETSCHAPSCADSSAIPEAFCNGTGACPSEAPVSCGGFACQGTGCGNECSNSSSCADGYYCAAGLCLPKKETGTACTNNYQCTSDFCVDGVCCESACNGQCEACAEPGHLGTCAAIAGTPRSPRTACASDTPACAGTCDGTTRAACTYPGAGTECRGQACRAAVVTYSAVCNGAGACGPLRTLGCGRYACDGTSCGAACAASASCTTGNGCIDSQCVPAFRVTPTVTSGHGQLACNETVPVGSSSTCHVVPQPGFTLVSLFDTPVGGQPQDVTALVDRHGTEDPNDDTYTTRVLETDHLLRAFFRQRDGVTCQAAADCRAGFCVDGVCCDQACTGQCEACDVPGSVGTCVAVTGAPRGDRTSCASDGSVCAGSCNGIERATCTMPNSTVVCRAPVCSGGIAVLSATCQGTGRCPLSETQNCGAFACGATMCLGDCTTDTDCIAGDYCAGGVCTARKGVGSSCAGAGQCLSGFCVDGVCCDQACTGQCEACDSAGRVGLCLPVNGSPRNGRSSCTGTGTCQGRCDGTITASCRYPSQSTACGQRSCASGTEIRAGGCDGHGSCVGGNSRDCAPFLCGATACLYACASDADCTSDSTCLFGTCVTRAVGPDAGVPTGDPQPDAGLADAPLAPEPQSIHATGGGWSCSLAGDRAQGSNGILAGIILALALLTRLRRVCLAKRRK